VTTRTVTLGSVGPATVEVTEGLTEGQRLVIADNSTALPTTSSTRRTGSFGGTGAGGALPGGAPPGGR
jgi:HlyD family secretion protein